jgi:DNA-binding PadR family transcriptional regulator
MSQSPMTEALLLVLLSLAEEPRHGYSIIKDVEQMTAGRVLLSTGTLYGALQRLTVRKRPVGHDRSEEVPPARS